MPETISGQRFRYYQDALKIDSGMVLKVWIGEDTYLGQKRAGGGVCGGFFKLEYATNRL